jgi:hypothetical protein
VYAVFGYWYERGVADTVGTTEALSALLEGAADDRPAEAEGVEVDLAGGVKSALHEVDRIRPHAVTLCVGPQRIAHIRWEPGAERLAGRHVAAAMVRQYHKPVFEALRRVGHVRLDAPAPVGGPEPDPPRLPSGDYPLTAAIPPARIRSSRAG